MFSLTGKRVLITGACGTIGAELVRMLLLDPAYEPSEVIGIDNNESQLFFLDQEFSADERARFFLADVRDRDALVRRMRGVDVVFHSAALKHVILCEKSPYDAVQTNIIGMQNVLWAASECDVERLVFTSSDKAVNPTNVMGTSKLMGERLTTAANTTHHGGRTVYTSTRFGNVLGSSGSVIPVFARQIERGGPVTLTDRRMTRFVMTVRQAVKLVLDTVTLCQGGEVFITKMPAIRIDDLAAVMIDELGPKFGRAPKEIVITEIGAKPGEKLYEELMSEEETRRAVELKDYFVVLPAFQAAYKNVKYTYSDWVSSEVTNPYVSAREPVMDRERLREFLVAEGLLPQA